MITVPLMALGGFLLVAVIWQGWLALAANGGGSAPANNSSSF
jgi:hypothetical protein